MNELIVRMKADEMPGMRAAKVLPGASDLAIEKLELEQGGRAERTRAKERKLWKVERPRHRRARLL